MRAIFKQEDPNILIVRDADWNEASLIIRYLDSIKNGAVIETKASYNGNQEVNGIVFTIKETEVKPAEDFYVSMKAEVVNDPEDLPVFRITLSSEQNIFNAFKVDNAKWNDFKEVLSALGLTDISITPSGDIVAANLSGITVGGTIVVPKGLLQFVDVLHDTTNNYSDSLVISLGEPIKPIIPDEIPAIPLECPICGKPFGDEEDSDQDEQKCQCARFTGDKNE